MNELLEQEVANRLAAKINNYDAVMKRHSELEEKLRNQNQRVHELQRDLADAEKTFVKQGADQTKRELLGGFMLGDKVWFVKKNYTRTPCETCAGDKKVEVTSVVVGGTFLVDCPTCRGYGSESHCDYSVAHGKLSEIHFTTWANGKCFEGKFYIEPTSYRSNDSVQTNHSQLFHSEEECQQAVNDILNSPTE
ncbi:hypothetical protein HP398_29835 [Brevibacillus sp. HB1.4B]|uniref:hypothetical protein n=1 Tax=Brevibacillus sp. HB1.4B TaxID=2738845 RepID=UPI00156B12A0|nr:hypothetical protein [Brevibacillus sp. HB1.4B]NRS20624.1 hypothetical protein [Brevibacillus sp. HB1.4B]